MPIISSTYQPPFLFRQMDFSTIYVAKFRKFKKIDFKEERFDLSDGDFLTLDWKKHQPKSNKIIVLLHGLEGNSRSQYNVGLARIFYQNGYDVCAVNYRGTGRSPNHKFISYHSGKTDDIHEVMQYIIHQGYLNVFLHGVSLGGNLALKFVGEFEKDFPQLKGVMAVSVPLDLSGSAHSIRKLRNKIYEMNFMRDLKRKLRHKIHQFPENPLDINIDKIKNIIDFDNAYTSQAHGFFDAEDYYKKNSALHFLAKINIPTYILNALNDSFLSKSCYPYDIAKNQSNIYLETPKYGGHVGFYLPGNIYYNEKSALKFANIYM